MKQKLLQGFGAALAVVLMAGAGWAVFFSLRGFWRALHTLDKQVAAGLLTASATIIVAVLTVVIGKQIEHRREIEQQNRLHKIDIYKDFMQQWFGVLSSFKGEEDARVKKSGVLGDEFRDFIVRFSSQVILWGNRDVIREYVRFRNMGSTMSGNPMILLLFERVLLEIRRDLGQSNKGFETGDLLRLFLTDPEKVTDALKESGKGLIEPESSRLRTR